MKFALKHPTSRRQKASCGVDNAIGVFVEVRDGDRLVKEYDALHPGYEGVPGALRILATYGFFTEAEAALALLWIQHSRAAEAEDPNVRRAAEVAERLYSPEQ